jgi:hypothetical protein
MRKIATETRTSVGGKSSSRETTYRLMGEGVAALFV